MKIIKDKVYNLENNKESEYFVELFRKYYKKEYNNLQLIIKFPNNIEGEYFLSLFKKYYNKDLYNIRVKYSQLNKKKMMKIMKLNKKEVLFECRYRNNNGNIKKDISNYIRIYLDYKYKNVWI